MVRLIRTVHIYTVLIAISWVSTCVGLVNERFCGAFGLTLTLAVVLLCGHNAPCGTLQRAVILAFDALSHHAFTVATHNVQHHQATKKSSRRRRTPSFADAHFGSCKGIDAIAGGGFAVPPLPSMAHSRAGRVTMSAYLARNVR
jgi:hypothetical protein